MVVVLAFAAACGKGDSEPATSQPTPIDARSGPTDTELAISAKRQVDLLEQLATAAAATAGDCPAMAKKLEAIVADNRAFYDRLAELIENDEAARKLDTLSDGLADRAEAAMRKLEPAIAPCLDEDAELSKVMDSILL